MGGAGGGSTSSSSSSSGGQGTPCTVPSNCGTTLTCEDGVCCEKTCGPCESCNLANSMGKCMPLPLGSDDCSINGQKCSMLGQCECGVSVPPISETPCPLDTANPSRWSGVGGTCTFLCNGADECKNEGTIACAEGSDCVIDCSGTGSCEGTTFVCPPGHKCTMKCPSMDSCKNSVLNCSDDGPCNVECTSGGMSCKVTVNCGFNSCSATCTDSTPTLIPKMNSVCAPMPCIP